MLGKGGGGPVCWQGFRRGETELTFPLGGPGWLGAADCDSALGRKARRMASSTCTLLREGNRGIERKTSLAGRSFRIKNVKGGISFGSGRRNREDPRFREGSLDL